MNKVIQETQVNKALDLLLEGGVDISKALEEGGLIKQFTKALLERALSEEMNAHLGYDRYSRSSINNARNGHYSKNLITDNGVIELNVPRDRNGDFEPLIVPKKQNRIAGLDKKILSLYAKGMSLADIKAQIYELYAADISESLISKITDGVMDEVKAWRVVHWRVYIALIYLLRKIFWVYGLARIAGAKFWLSNLTEMKNRGMQDMLIACTDNLPGMSEAISAVYPKCEPQLCL
jgi:transposase-like protein